jgi:hypothetical protein
MDISGDTSNVDYIKYITKQLPKDLVNMLALRDELAVRQGALSAAEAAVADRGAAAAELAAAKEEAAAIKADAAKANAKSKEREAAVATREAAVSTSETVSAKLVADTEADLAARLKACASLEAAQAKQNAVLTERSTKLDNDAAALETRVKAFQAKVAALSA